MEALRGGHAAQQRTALHEVAGGVGAVRVAAPDGQQHEHRQLTVDHVQPCHKGGGVGGKVGHVLFGPVVGTVGHHHKVESAHRLHDGRVKHSAADGLIEDLGVVVQRQQVGVAAGREDGVVALGDAVAVEEDALCAAVRHHGGTVSQRHGSDDHLVQHGEEHLYTVHAFGQRHAEAAFRLGAAVHGAAVDQQLAVHQHVEVAEGAAADHFRLVPAQGQHGGVGVEVQPHAAGCFALGAELLLGLNEVDDLGGGHAVKVEAIRFLPDVQRTQRDGLQLLKIQIHK